MFIAPVWFSITRNDVQKKMKKALKRSTLWRVLLCLCVFKRMNDWLFLFYRLWRLYLTNGISFFFVAPKCLTFKNCSMRFYYFYAIISCRKFCHPWNYTKAGKYYIMLLNLTYWKLKWQLKLKHFFPKASFILFGCLYAESEYIVSVYMLLVHPTV